MWLSAIHRLQVGQEGSGGHSGVALSPKPRTPSGERRGRREGRDFPQRDPPPISPTETTQCPDPESLTRDRSVNDVRTGVPMPEAPGRERHRRAVQRPRRGCGRGGDAPASRASTLPKDAAKLAPPLPHPPLPHAPRRLLHAARHSPAASALGPAGLAASSPPFSSPPARPRAGG